MIRPTKHHTFMEIALALSRQSTCTRRSVGAVLVNHRQHIIGSGYNGPAARQPHCIVHPCRGSRLESGTGLELCEAIHAEQNALLQCHDVYTIERIYVTVPPCLHCTKLLLNTSCRHIISMGTYPMEDLAQALWQSAGCKWEKFNE